MTMRAIVADRPGGPDVLKMENIEDLEPAAGQLLVKTGAVGVNFIEIYQREGIYPVDFPFTPGTEGSGTVVSVGEGVTAFAAGDRVATNAGTATYADHFLVPATEAVEVPDGISMEQAAAVPLQGCTAHYLTYSSATPKEDDVVLVHAGAGGVGQLLTQLLAAEGVRVVTTASSDEKRELSRAAGAELSVDYSNFPEAVREFTGGAGVDVVYDGVGQATFDGSLESLRVRGQMVLFGGASGQVPPFDLQRLSRSGSVSISRPSLPHFMLTPEERNWRYGELFDAIAAGTLRIEIGATYPLADAARAQEALQERRTTGKVVLLP